MPGTPKAKHPARRRHNVHAARDMRKNPTSAEDILWQALRNRQIADAKFRRQHSIDRFIVDFYCAEAQLVIEVDGAIHDQPSNDAARQEHLEALGLHVLRITNADIDSDLSAVVARIRAALNA